METPVVDADRPHVIGRRGRAFVKMSGSGNDFVVFDARAEPALSLAEESAIRALCARGTGVGADGVVFLEPSSVADVRVRYFNADGSLAALCGNATLCAARLTAEGRGVDPAGFAVETDDGVLAARISGGRPEITMRAVEDLRVDVGIPLEPGERRMGFARAGVPHLVVLCDDVDQVDVDTRGAPLRGHSSLSDGANVNFVSGRLGRWRMRTFERGVEGETLACGTGAVATATLLAAWGEDGDEVALTTRSGCLLTVRQFDSPGGRRPSLSGEARIVFRGELAELG